MKYIIEVVRRRSSVTQGSALVLVNGVEVADFYDEIKLLKKGEHYYGENIGVMAITKVYSVWVIGGAAVFAILLSFIGKLSELIHSIPVPVMGGVCILLFGVIAASGLRVLVESRVDYSKSSNLVMTAVIMIIGLSGAKLTFGTISVQGMVLATLVAIVLSVTFKILDRLGFLNHI